MFHKEIATIIRKYGAKGYIVYESFRKPITIIFSSLKAPNTPPKMGSCGMENRGYYTGITPITESKITDGDTLCIHDRLFSVISAVTYECNGKGLYRKILLLEKGGRT